MIQECIKSNEGGKPYSQAIKIGDFIYISGQCPDNVIGFSTYEQTQQCFEKIASILESCGISLKYILKTTVYLTDLNDIEEVDRAYAERLSDPYPVRSTVSVRELPHSAGVVIEAFAMDTRALEILCEKGSERNCGEKECSLDG